MKLPFSRLAAGAAALLVSTAALAQSPAPPVRVRGQVESLAGSTLTVRSREGASVAITLADNVGVSGIVRASLVDIKPGTFVGIASAPTGSGPSRALEVLVFPAGAKSNEGHYGWDLLPESTMTNATVASTVENVSGPVLTLAYPGGEQRIAVGPETPIVTFAPASRDDLKPGAPVFVPATRSASGALSTMRVIVGNNGIAPPM
jgi:hypothetical protein